MTPSVKLTETGAAAAGHGTITRTNRANVAALVNDLMVNQEVCAPSLLAIIVI